MVAMGSERERVGTRTLGGRVLVQRWSRLVAAVALVVAAVVVVALTRAGSGGGPPAPASVEAVTTGRSTAATTAAAVGADGVRWPVGVAGRRVVDQFGVPFPLKIMSAWGMAQRLSNPEITAALEGLRAQGFNAVNVAGVGGVNVQADWTPG